MACYVLVCLALGFGPDTLSGGVWPSTGPIPLKLPGESSVTGLGPVLALTWEYECDVAFLDYKRNNPPGCP